MTLPRLTVVTPSLNQADFIERTILSVLEQDIPDLEYIVIDGGSIDGTLDILRRYEGRLTWISEADSGQSAAINKGFARASGDVLAYINSDDYYVPGGLRPVLEAFSRRPDARWVVGRCRYERDDGSLVRDWLPERPKGRRARWIRELWYVPQASSFWRRDVVAEFGGVRDDLHYVMDAEFGLRLAVGGVLPHTLDHVVAVRFEHAAAKSADTTRFELEWERVRPELAAALPRRVRLVDNALRALARPPAAFTASVYHARQRLGLLHLRRRLNSHR